MRYIVNNIINIAVENKKLHIHVCMCVYVRMCICPYAYMHMGVCIPYGLN